MPLPAENSAFPPAPFDTAYASYAENEAWYLGDLKKLGEIYSQNGATRQATHLHNGTLHRGGLMGGVSRMFWGRPVPPGQESRRLHIPAPADLAMLAADYGFAEPPTVALPAKVNTDTTTSTKIDTIRREQVRLDLIANSDAVKATWNEMGELKSVFGACAVITEWDREVADHPWLRSVAADSIIPEWRGSKLSALTLWTGYPDPNRPNVVYRHLQRHEVGRIVNRLYKGTSTKIGSVVPLQTLPQTEYLAAITSEGQDEGTLLTGIKRLTASYNINMPSREWRKLGDLRNAGRSDFAGILPLFDQLDETWTAWSRSIRLSRARITAPAAFLTSNGPGQASTFDEDREVFTGLDRPIGDSETGSGLDFFQPDIPVEQYEATAYALYREILRAAGYSPSAWGEYGNQVKTATEVQDREKSSERTRDKKALYDKAAISEQASVALEIDGLVFPGKGGGRFDLPSVSFPAVSQSDPLRDAQVIGLLDGARAITVDTKVRTAHPDWDDARVRKEVDGILADSQPAADPASPSF
ncbi:hypothetical protein [Mycetocola saprophilus]|uniref:hypothetical protein n=1 Tax=Mycetocola saprophilus TaxID=76636 RepID=UPI0004C15952|nr:hypothetical protein [Mycetocola saprophilus]